MIPRFLNIQGLAGVVASLALAVLLLVQKGETHHWKKESASFEQRYRQEQSAFAGTIANYRAAAEAARAADDAKAERIAAEQSAINQRTQHDFETRLAAARADAQRLRIQAAANSRPGGGPSVSGLPASPGGTAQSAGENGLSEADALIATEQAIQLDELIKWIRAQAKVDNAPPAVASPRSD